MALGLQEGRSVATSTLLRAVGQWPLPVGRAGCWASAPWGSVDREGRKELYIRTCPKLIIINKESLSIDLGASMPTSLSIEPYAFLIFSSLFLVIASAEQPIDFASDLRGLRLSPLKLWPSRGRFQKRTRVYRCLLFSFAVVNFPQPGDGPVGAEDMVGGIDIHVEEVCFHGDSLGDGGLIEGSFFGGVVLVVVIHS